MQGRTWCACVLVGEQAQAEDANTHCACHQHDGRDAACCRVCRAASHVLTGLWAQGRPSMPRRVGNVPIIYRNDNIFGVLW